MRLVRKIIKIDEEKCDGCGQCIPACPEGALKIIDGKARLVSESYCDGLGACIGMCPKGALIIEEREAEPFDEEAVNAIMGEHNHTHEPIRWEAEHTKARVEGWIPSALTNWPVKLELVNPRAPFFKNADLLVVADCVAYAYGNLYNDMIPNKVVVIGCPKFGHPGIYENKLAEIFSSMDMKSVHVVNMEVPCCFGLHHIVKRAMERSGKGIPLKKTVISIKGEKLGD
ncbi:MAG: 4Fe-4S ferredoxin [Thermoproteota archaeon]|nr:MAG: 4Fe-4S ferredoxin [Candidatus Korarchaeota archaeon]